MALVLDFSRFIPVWELVQILQKIILSSVNKYMHSETNFITIEKKKKIYFKFVVCCLPGTGSCNKINKAILINL